MTEIREDNADHIQRAVHGEQVALLYRQSMMAFLSAVVTVAGVYVVLRGQVEILPLTTWTAIVLVCNFYLLFLRTLYYRSAPNDRSSRIFERLFNLQALIHGATWGALTPLVLLSNGSDLSLAFAVMVTLGMAAGSIMATGSVYRIFLSYLLPATLPSAVALTFYSGSTTWVVTGLLILAYCIALVSAAWVYAQSVRESLSLRFQNSDLVNDLLAQKHHNDEVRVRLEQEIDTRRRAEDSLNRAKQAAESANDAKSRFLANMSHEIRTPLTSILGFAEMLDDEKDDPPRLANHIAAINRNGRHLLNLINEVLDFSKIEAGRMELERVPVDLFPFIEEIRSTYGYLAPEKGLEFSLNAHYPLPRTIYTDPTRLKQIVFNLLSNALKFTADGAVTVDVAYARSDSKLMIAVSDTGLGMSRTEVSKLFRPFTQADASTTRHYGGTGLGLSISRRLADLLEGDLEVSTEKGKGSCFTLALRSGVRDDTELLWEAPDADAIISTAAQPLIQLSGRVLLVEDNLDIQTLVGSFLRKLGPQVELATNGLQALELLSTRRFDLVFLDMQMPVMDGLETLKRMRANSDMTPVVTLTANAMEEDRLRYLKAGSNDFLGKPVDRAAMARLLADYLPEQEAADASADDEDEVALMWEFRQRFVQRLPEYVERLDEYQQSEDWPALQFLVHDLKGMGAGFGFPRISQLSGAIEALLKNNESAGLHSLLQELRDICCEAVGIDQH